MSNLCRSVFAIFQVHPPKYTIVEDSSNTEVIYKFG